MTSAVTDSINFLVAPPLCIVTNSAVQSIPTGVSGTAITINTG